MHRKLILSILCFFGLTLSMLAQQKGQITGVIKDAETNETLIGVSIYEEKSQLGTTTDEKGYYSLDLPYGDHRLRISYIGYTTVEKKVSISNKPVTLNVKLYTESERLSEVESPASARTVT